MMYSYKTEGVCARNITFDVKENKIFNLKFEGGCNGNLKGLSAMVEGQEVDSVIDRLEDIKCGSKSTSCPDQLSKALREYKASQK